MISVMLDTSELLVLLDALRTEQVPGLKLEYPTDLTARQTLLQEGQQRLRLRGLLSDRADGSLALDEALVLMGAVIAYPDLLCLTQLQTSSGEQQFVHAFCDGLMVEQRASHGGIELLSGGGVVGLLNQLRERLTILPATLASEDDAPLLLAPATLATVTELLTAGDITAATNVLAQLETPENVIQTLFATLSAPQLSGRLTLLRYQGGSLVTCRQLAFVANQHGAWWIAPALGDSPTLRVRHVGARRLLSYMAAQLRQLGVAPRAAYTSAE